MTWYICYFCPSYALKVSAKLAIRFSQIALIAFLATEYMYFVFFQYIFILNVIKLFLVLFLVFFIHYFFA